MLTFVGKNNGVFDSTGRPVRVVHVNGELKRLVAETVSGLTGVATTIFYSHILHSDLLVIL